ncbi:MAG TPA: pantoate--beta-alanine ligase [Thermoanaerobaculia bacterium]|nr:pantoate--beta-alanine ligase [Thermoanaerobaculia bacterium]MDI9632425.1 pantoate--beta-alanine ligase [Acidobacteriota bacterium]MBP7812934.1 pantoate--beta-alanine ligase [Thermoanaerobaculia bacterium]HQN37950.1 pantoate--beta-alanine ligase [Thermoanaerobaculia bacterium]HQP92910.1 pantoate--beta-alanine ligase [Thermoanaerobaculia bacterium]
MRTVREPAELQMAVRQLRRDGMEIGFVPTMGALHAGHLSLVEIARRRGALVVVSVFVNPTQFGPGEDLDRYPRQPERDAGMLHEAGCDLLFLPSVETIYPPGNATRIHVEGAARGYEGKLRPGHFDGVATVVTILFQLVRPNFAVFGEKDAQQLAVVRQLVRDLHLPVEIVAGPTKREPDGLAMSSRNAYLSPDEREAATVLSRALAAAGDEIAAGERRAAAIRRRLRDELQTEPRFELDYADVVDALTFQPVTRLAGRVVIPVAGRVGNTRLLDNLQLELPGESGG